MSVFTHADYLSTLRERLGSGDRGYQGRMATAAQVHPSYFSRVLSGRVHLSSEQAFRLARFWGLNERERAYFELLVLLARSGDADYRASLERRAKVMRDEASELENRVEARTQETGEGNVYYANWLYSALHMLLTVPELATSKALAKRLRLPVTEVELGLRQLAALELVREVADGKWAVTENNVLLGRSNWMARLQHSNWRIRALERLGRAVDGDVNYTGVHSLSARDLERLRRRLKDFFVEIDALVRPSKEETVAVFCADLFEL